MSQNTSQSITPTDLSARHPWVSEITLARCVPWVRAVIDCLLITFGAFLAFNLGAIGDILECVNWESTAFRCGQSTLGIAGALMVYFTARSNHWRERERVLVCLSIVLLLTSGLSLVSMILMQWPESMYAVQMLAASLAGYALVCMGMIAVEKRMLAVVRSDAVHRTASVRQALGRIFWAGVAFMVSLSCLLTPAYLVYAIVSGSLWGVFESTFGEPLNNLSYVSLVLLVVGSKLYQIAIANRAWVSLADFHRPKLRPYKERFKKPATPMFVAAMIFSFGSIASCVLLVLFQIGLNAAPWALLVVSIVSCLAYRKSPKVGAEL